MPSEMSMVLSAISAVGDQFHALQAGDPMFLWAVEGVAIKQAPHADATLSASRLTLLVEVEIANIAEIAKGFQPNAAFVAHKMFDPSKPSMCTAQASIMSRVIFLSMRMKPSPSSSTL